MILRSTCRTISPTLSLSSRRKQSTSSLDQWIKEITSNKTTHDDTIDSLRAAQLLRSLPTRQDRSSVQVNDGDVLDQGHHMIYFQPETMLRDLGQDGSSPEYNAPPPYTRRMWAGGSIRWPLPSESNYNERILRTGSKVLERRSVDKVEVKKGMVFVHQRREIFNASSAGEVEEGDGWGVQEIRTHVFRPPPDSSSLAPTAAGSSTSPPQTSAPTSSPPRSTMSAKQPSPVPSPVYPGSISPSSSSPSCSFTYTPSSALLFRYSALTFNSHRIHYDHPHTLSIESQPGLLVHGPLTATLLIELAAKYASERGKRLVEFRYRAVSPVVVDKEVVMRGWARDQGQDGKEVEMEMTAEQGGKVGMKATAIIE